MTDFDFGEDFDAIFDIIGDVLREAEKDVIALVDPVRMKRFFGAYNALKALARDGGATVSYILHEPHATAGNIHLTGNYMVFSCSPVLQEVLDAADNIEIDAQTDGSVHINITFYHLTIPLE